MRVILRDPQTDQFTGTREKDEIPAPGLAILDGDGKLVAACDLKAASSSADVVELLKKFK